jgi:hypothetical protein
MLAWCVQLPALLALQLSVAGSCMYIAYLTGWGWGITAVCAISKHAGSFRQAAAADLLGWVKMLAWCVQLPALLALQLSVAGSCMYIAYLTGWGWGRWDICVLRCLCNGLLHVCSCPSRVT